MFRTLKGYQLTIDITVAALCLLLRFVFGFDTLSGFSWLLPVSILMAGALALRRVSPPLALAIAWLGAIIQMAAGAPPDPSNIAILAVLYATARYGEPRTKWAGLISAGVGSLAASTYLVFFGAFTGVVSAGTVGAVPQAVLGFLVFLLMSVTTLGLSWVTGLLVRTWRGARDEAAARRLAEQSVVVEQERNRIARDMHDVVAHSLAVVIAQADGARYARATDPEAVDGALTTIASTAREALADVRVLLGQLRHNQTQGPQPALADLDVLLDQVRASGLDVSIEQTGTPALPTAAQLAIYRIVQEALTNALRHGDASVPVVVRLDAQPTEVTLSVASVLKETDGPRAPVLPGHGLTGMRERAILVGGTLSAGVSGQRFVVDARIPTSN